MKIDLSIITKSINKELTQEADISLTSFRSRLGDFPIVRKAPVTLQIRNEENAAVFVKGTVDIDVMIPCARCLEEVRTPIRFDIDKKLTVQEEGLVDEEMEKLDNWAGDMKLALEREISDLDQEIRLRKSEAKKIGRLEEKVKAQRAIKEMERKRIEKRQNLFNAQDEIDEKKELLLSRIEKMLQQKAQQTELFTIKWRII